MSWSGKYRGALKYKDGVLFLGFLWISYKSNAYTTESWFSHLQTIYNLYVFLFPLIYIYFMSWNCKYGGALKYCDVVLFLGFPWISCENNVWTRESWFSHFATITICTYFYFLLVFNYFMSRNGKYHGDLNDNDGVLFFGFAWISYKNNVCMRESEF